jgi:hypothetical protein
VGLFVEFLISVVIFVMSRWWLLLPLVALLYYLLRRFELVRAKDAKELLTIVGVLIVVLVLAPRVVAPVINYYGQLAIGEVTSSKATLFSDVAYNRTYSMKAIYEKDDGSTKSISYWSNVPRVYPLFTGYDIPDSVGDVFILKYLPLMPSEFIFKARLSDKEREKLCPQLTLQLDELQISEKALAEERREVTLKLERGLSPEERRAFREKIRRAKNLTEVEQRKKTLDEEVLILNKKTKDIKEMMLSDSFCAE